LGCRVHHLAAPFGFGPVPFGACVGKETVWAPVNCAGAVNIQP
jgi:hypothetical protein